MPSAPGGVLVPDSDSDAVVSFTNLIPTMAINFGSFGNFGLGEDERQLAGMLTLRGAGRPGWSIKQPSQTSRVDELSVR